MYLLIKLMSFIQLQAGTIFFQWASWRLENADYFGILGSNDARYYTPNTGQLMVIFADTFFQTDINLVWGHDKRATIKLRTIVLLGGARNIPAQVFFKRKYDASYKQTWKH